MLKKEPRMHLHPGFFFKHFTKSPYQLQNGNVHHL